MKTILATSGGVLLALLHSWVVAPALQPSSRLPDWVERLGWTLVHSLWQLTAVAVIAAMVGILLKRRSAMVRYLAAVIALGAMAGLPCVTWTLIDVSKQSGIMAGQPIRSIPTPPILPSGEPVPHLQNTSESNLPAAMPDPLIVILEPSSNQPADATTGPSRSQVPDELMPPQTDAIDDATAIHSVLANEKPSGTAWGRLVDRSRLVVEPNLPWLVWLWLTGVVVCSLRPVWGLWMQWRLRRVGLSVVSDELQRTLVQLTHRMGLRRFVRLAESACVNVPMVVGYMRPMILLPASILTGLTPNQLESLLAHELAHVRRHDWLVNALQVVVETLLFYHPAVWWLSNRIRNERELCCDDVALAVVGDRAVYARMLLRVEELRHANPGKTMSAPSSIAATGGDLVHRVRRLLPAGYNAERASRGWLSGALLLLTLGILGGVSAMAVHGQNEPEPTIEQSKPEPAIADDVPDKPTKETAADNQAKDAAQKEPADAATNDKQDQSADRPASVKKTEKTANDRKRSVRVIDENKQAIAGATVQFQFESENTIFASLSMITGGGKTNEKGEYSEEIPDGAERVHITVKADGFGEFSGQQPASAGSSVVELKHGRVIRVRAVDVDHKLLKQAVPLLSQNRVWGREFVPQPDGTFKSPPVAMTRRMMRVCAAQENGPTLYSELVDVATAKPEADGVLELVLKPGVRLTGRLADSVPRPITEGYVDLFIVEGPDHTFASDAFRWEDSTPVQPDGTFTYESIPGGGHAQFHVVVDGYMSVNPTGESILEYVQKHQAANEEMLNQYRETLKMRSHEMWPQFVPLDRPEVEVTVECEKTASCDFRIVDSAGNPIPNAVVSFSPNGATLSANLFIPGTHMFAPAGLVDTLSRGSATINLFGSSDDSPRAVRERKEREWATKSFLGAKSDAQGRVQIRNLPGRGRESFYVTADGYVLPRSPVYQRDNDERDDDRRQGYVNLVAGQTNEATITLERDLKVVDREVLVIDEKGRPQTEVTVAVAEMRVGRKDWQLWSTQRFGTLPKEVTDDNGRVLLKVPSLIDRTRVQRLRLAVNYWNSRRGDRIWVNGELVDVPLVADKGVIVLAPNADPSRPGSAVYGKLEDILPKQSTEQLLAGMIEKPSLAVLRQLLAAAKGRQPEPIELLDEHRFSGGDKAEKAFLVKVVPAGDSKLAVVAARVRPADGTRANVTNPSELPECAFVFDMQGKLVAAVGGRVGTTGSGSPDHIDIVSIGPEEDWFVRSQRFQQNGTFEYQSEYYRVANPVVKSLKYYHYANSNGWSMGPEKITRWGTLSFDFPNSKEAYDSPGHSGDGGPATTAEGVPVVRTLTWDGDRNLFIGAPAQFGMGKPLYQVDVDWSREFEPIALKPNQLFVTGGERNYDHWYSWHTVVPEKHELLLTITIPQAEGEPTVIERRLASGKRHIQIQLKPIKDNASARLKLRLDSIEPEVMELPIQIGERPEKHLPITQILNPGESARLLDRSLKSSTRSFIAEINLRSAAPTE